MLAKPLSRKVRKKVLRIFIALAPIEGKILLWRRLLRQFAKARVTQKIGMIAGIAPKKNATLYTYGILLLASFILKNLAGFFEFLHVVDQLEFVYNFLDITIHDVS